MFLIEHHFAPAQILMFVIECSLYVGWKQTHSSDLPEGLYLGQGAS